ncbi:MAG: thioesterase family protein [Phocaeicola sp.]|nr:thioesterase family protein [Phocaeicola sp.]
MLETGLVHTSVLSVKEEDTAIAMGSGDIPVLATPAMIALMENAAMLTVASQLPEGYTTVGGQISISHMRPTAIGSIVTATAVLENIDGKKLFFRVEARQNEEVIGEGTHLRYIVEREKFLASV